MIERILRLLPLFKGKERLARVLLNTKSKSRKNFLINGKYGCKYVVPNIAENIGFEIFINGIYEQETSDYFIRNLPVNGVFLDLGANIGAISIPIFKKRSDVRIVCVEAAQWIFKYLQQNLELNKTDTVHAINNVLFYTDNEEVNFYAPDEKFGKGSLSPVFTEKIIRIKTIKLDTLIQNLKIKPDFIKIDVEGYEYHVFKGATNLLKEPNSPDILFEFVDWAEEQANGIEIGASQKLLREMGYRIFYFKEKGEMQEVTEIILKGFFMLYASKRKNIN